MKKREWALFRVGIILQDDNLRGPHLFVSRDGQALVLRYDRQVQRDVRRITDSEQGLRLDSDIFNDLNNGFFLLFLVRGLIIALD